MTLSSAYDAFSATSKPLSAASEAISAASEPSPLHLRPPKVFEVFPAASETLSVSDVPESHSIASESFFY